MFGGLKNRLAQKLSEKGAQIQRDLGMLVKGIRGDSAPTFTERHDKRDEPVTLHGRKLQIQEVVRETPNAVSLVLVDPTGAPIEFQAGQFFTLAWPPKSRVTATTFEKRAYSASSSPLDTSRVTVTIKRVEGGKVSSAIHATAAAGDVVEVLGPSGAFTIPDGDGDLVLFGGGSGITPLMSITRTVLEGPGSKERRVFLVFGNRSEEEIIFDKALTELVAAHPERLFVRHVLETKGSRESAEGRLEQAVVDAELDRLGDKPRAPHYFLCGPEPMMNAAEQALLGRGVPAAKIRIERFVTLRRAEGATRTEHEATVLIKGKKRSLFVSGDETLLEAGTRMGVDLPFSCTVGGCGACRVKLTGGKVTMDEPNCLSPEEAAENYILGCVSRLDGPITVEVE